MPDQAGFAFRGTISERFQKYCREHPDVEQHLVRLAREAKLAGFRRYGVKALFERLRWHYHIERQDADWKINNDFTAPYARLLMSKYPELADFFETRERHCA